MALEKELWLKRSTSGFLTLFLEELWDNSSMSC